MKVHLFEKFEYIEIIRTYELEKSAIISLNYFCTKEYVVIAIHTLLEIARHAQLNDTTFIPKARWE